MIEYNKRLKEVYEILQYLPYEDYSRIPKELIESIKNEMDPNHVFEFDITKALDEQNISVDTLSLLAYINTEYLLNEQQKDFMKKIYQYNKSF